MFSEKSRFRCYCHLSYQWINVTPKMFGSLLVINHFSNYWLDCSTNCFYTKRKTIQMFSRFSFYTHKKKIYCKFVSKRIAWVFFWWHENVASHNVLNWYTSNWLLYSICVVSMGVYTNVNSLIFWVHYSSQNIIIERISF